VTAAVILAQSEPIFQVAKAADNGTANLPNVPVVAREVLLGGKALQDEDMKAIIPLVNSNAIVKLHLADNQFGDAAAEALAAALESNESLTYVSLHKNRIGSQGGMAFAKAVRANATLKTLFLTMNPIGDDALVAIDEANKARKIPMVGLNGLVMDQPQHR
jgi:hypothetical protein